MTEYAIGTKVVDPGTGIEYVYVGGGNFDHDGELFSLAGVEESQVHNA